MTVSPRRKFIRAVRAVTHRLGFDIVRYDPFAEIAHRRQRFLSHLGISLVFDVGANTGQYAEGLRAEGYRGRIVSF